MAALTCASCGRGNPGEALFCMGCGARLGATATSRESRRVVTALFCDLVGSTALGERHDPEVLRPLLDRYFAEAREAVERHGGRVEKFIGDAVSAVFGLPAAHEDDALRAVRAGLEVQERLARLREGSPIPLDARIGITTGEVLVPGGGAPLIGDAMNTASRLQSGASPGEVLVGEPTWRLVRHAVAAVPAAPLAARGKAEPVPAWRVLALAPGSPARARRMDAPMVGRDREAALLASAYRRAVDEGSCRLLTVLGVAGAGKSRLVEEFLGSLGEDAEVLRGRCLSYGEGITWLPLAEALRPALGLAEFAGPDDVADAVRAAAGEGPDAAAVAAGLGGLFGLPGSGSGEQTAWAVRRLLESRARLRPVVLVLDDVHWAEPALLDLVEHLAERADAPLLMLCMARPELLDARPGWGAGAGASDTVSLAPLTPADADTLVDALLGGAALPSEARDRVVTAAEGNPLFLEEVLRMLVDEGRLLREGDAWVVAGELSGLHIPPTVSALLSSRLDRLPEAERSLLEAASVEGQSFSAGALEALLPEASRDTLQGLLRSLARKDLIAPERRGGPGRDGYRFRHLLIRDAAYDAVPKSSRARLHLAFADWLEAAAGDALAEHREVLGHHLAQAHRYRAALGLPDDPDLRMRAARALGDAGARADDELGDWRTAMRLLEAAIDLAPGTVDSARWERQFSNLAYIVLRVEPGRRSWEVNRAAYGDEVADTLAARDARFIREGADPSTVDVEAGRLDDLRALELYRTRGVRHLEPGVLMRLSEGALDAGDPSAAAAWARDALRLAEDLGWRHNIQAAAFCLLNALAAGPTPLGRVVSEADVILERWGSRLAARNVLGRRAEARALMGDPARARADLDESERLRVAVGMPVDFTELEVEPFVALADGDLALAASRFAEVISLAPADEQKNRNMLLLPAARVLADLGRDADAEEALSPLGRSGLLQDRATHRSLRARLLARRGDVAGAIALAEEAAALVAPSGLEILKADVALDRGHVLLAAGRRDAARASAEDALRRHRAKEHEVGARRAVSLLGAIAHQR